MKRALRSVIAIIALCATAGAAPTSGYSSQRYWVYFTDRGEATADFDARVAAALARLTPAARARRAKAGYLTPLDPWDLAPPAAYVAAAAAAAGGDVVVTSRWLNAVSIAASPEAALAARALPFVAAVAPVAGWPAPELAPSGRRPPPPRDDIHGLSFDQLKQLQIVELHKEGYWGKGVTVGVLDTGFNLNHESLVNVNVIAARDFTVEGDWREDQGGHGTAILSVVGGSKAGVFMGAAPAADFIIAKTELVSSETPVEEDWYVAGMEWAEALGADVLSTSLGYLDWYTYKDMDGETAVTTRAANVAGAKGLLLITANGNQGQDPNWPWMIAPADAFKTLGVGAVDKDGVIAGWSSRGPTYDGRIKPNICARGVDTWCAQTADPHGYFPSAGTSLATPLAAGAAALLIEKRPDLTPDEVRMALMKTATRAAAPDNFYGYGIVQTRDATLFEPASIPPFEKPYLRLSFPRAFSPNGDGDADTLDFAVFAADGDGVEYWQLAVTTPADAGDVKTLFFGSGEVNDVVTWDGRDLAGSLLPPGDYRATLSAWDRFANLATLDGGTFHLEAASKSLAAARVFPNPFAPARGHRAVHFAGLPPDTDVAVYNLAGELVWRRFAAAGGEVTWDGASTTGSAAAAGVYLYRLRGPGGDAASGKLAILR